MVSLNNGILISLAPAGNSTLAAVVAAGAGAALGASETGAGAASFIGATVFAAPFSPSSNDWYSSPSLPTIAIIWFILAASPAGTPIKSKVPST